MGTESLFLTIVLGTLCGFVAAKIVRGEGMGFLRNVLAGVCGSVLGSAIFHRLGLRFAPGFWGTAITAVFGAVVILVFIGVVRNLVSGKRAGR